MSSQILVNSTHITDTVNNSTFKVQFDRAVDLTDKTIALSGLSLYYSWRNITSKNNVIKYVWSDNVEYTITLPEGFYEVSDIYSYCRFIMTKNNHYLIDSNSDYVYYFEMSVNNTSYSIDILTYPIPSTLPEGYSAPPGFTFASNILNPIVKLPYGMSEILGYSSNFETSQNVDGNTILQYQSTQAPNVNPNNSIMIVCDEVSNEFESIGVMYALAPSVSIGSLIDEKVSSPLYLKIKSGRYDSLTFRILNAKTYEPMEIYDSEISMRMSIK